MRKLKRSQRYGVGKEIGGAIYLHRQYEERLGEPLLKAKTFLPIDFPYSVVKYQCNTGIISFIESTDFDTTDEPTVGRIVSVKPTGEMRLRPQPRDPEIYHHKWLFVADDYQGFDIEASKMRTIALSNLSNVDRRRIGRRAYWVLQVIPRLSLD
jgi:hypothetical protein